MRLSPLRPLVFGALLALSAPVVFGKPPKVDQEWIIEDNCELHRNSSNDGDSFHFGKAGLDSIDADHILRLYFVDTPEDNRGLKRIDEQADYGGTDVETVVRFSREARKFTADFLSEPFRIYTRTKAAPGASRQPRWYRVAQRMRDNLCLHTALVEAGLARPTSVVCDFPTAEYGAENQKKLLEKEAEAKTAHRGIWSASAPSTRRDKAPPMATGEKLDLNRATALEIEALPGIGPKLAQAIIAARPFRTLEDFSKVPGIGEKKWAALRDRVGVSR